MHDDPASPTAPSPATVRLPRGSMTMATTSTTVGLRFGVAVRQLREKRGWSQERLANRAELNRSYMGEIERATAMPSLATAAKLADALEVPLSELIARCELADRPVATGQN
jgi:ribosome-binding protein aMBF1 (putative translation factor)